jgi:1,4-alpha-glucan branching enzyme
LTSDSIYQDFGPIDELPGQRSTMYRHLGAHLHEQGGVAGTYFRVWAPNALEVSVTCDRNGWQHGANHLSPSENGVWWGFLAGIRAGEKYKYSLRNIRGEVAEKSDPFAFAAELRPATASIVCDLDAYSWSDDEWIKRRGGSDWSRQPLAIYEVHLGSWRRPTDGREFFSYEELAEMLVEYCLELSYTHIQLMPVTEHPFDGSWGYQVTGYFAPTSRFGSPQGFMHLVDSCHQAGIGVLTDWVPGHFPNDPHGLGRFDGTALFEHEDPRKGVHPDWDTYIFNYGRTEVRDFLLSSARFWCEQYHIDGLRVDAVASMLYLDYSRPYGEWLPNREGGRENLDAITLLKDANTMLHREFPGVMTCAEESTSWPGVSRPISDGGLGFTMKWDMGWMHDTLRYLRRDSVHRKHHHNELLFRMVYAFNENFVLPLSHDEVVHGKRSLLSQMPGDDWEQFANLRLLYCYEYAMPGKKLLFMGGEIAQWLEWDHDGEVDWALCEFSRHQGVQQLIGDLNRVYIDESASHEADFTQDGFQWIQCDDAENSVISLLRFSASREECLVFALNLTPVLREGYRLGVTGPGFYRELLNSDAERYGGSNIGNAGGVYSDEIPSDGFEQSISVTLPPLGMIVFKP